MKSFMICLLRWNFLLNHEFYVESSACFVYISYEQKNLKSLMRWENFILSIIANRNTFLLMLFVKRDIILVTIVCLPYS